MEINEIHKIYRDFYLTRINRIHRINEFYLIKRNLVYPT